MEYSSVALAVVGVIGCAGLAAYQMSGTCKSSRKVKVAETSDSKGKKQNAKKNEVAEKPQQQPKQKPEQKPAKQEQKQQQQPAKQAEPKQQAPKQQQPEQKSTKQEQKPAKQEQKQEQKPAKQEQKQQAQPAKQDKKAAKEAQNPEIAALQAQINAALAQGDVNSLPKLVAQLQSRMVTATAAAAPAESAEVLATPDFVEAQKKEYEALQSAEDTWETVPDRKQKLKDRKAEEKKEKDAAAAAAAAAASSKKGDEAEEKKEEKKKVEKKTIEVTIDPTKRSKLIGPEASVIKRIAELFPEVRVDVPKKDAPKQDIVKITGEATEIENVKRVVVDLTTRGFSKVLDPEICDSHTNVPSDKLNLIMGRGGATISAIQRETGTSITKQTKTESAKARTVGKDPQDTLIIVGKKDGVEAAKRAIKQILTDGYARIIHPDWITIKVDFPAEHRSKLIGAGGGRIKKLKELYKCEFKFPESSDDEYINIIGPAGELMQQAQVAIVGLREHFMLPPQSRVVDGFDDEDADAAYEGEW